MTFTCLDNQIHEISWIVEPYIPENDPIKYSAQVSEVMEHVSHFSANLTKITNITGNKANMVTSLRVNTAELGSETNITIICRTGKGSEQTSHATLFFAHG